MLESTLAAWSRVCVSALLAQSESGTEGAGEASSAAENAPVAESLRHTATDLGDGFLNLTLKNWIEIGAITVLAVLAGWLVRMIAGMALRAWMKRRGGDVHDKNVRKAAAPFGLIAAGVAVLVSIRFVSLPSGVTEAIALGARLALAFGAVWCGFRLVNIAVDVARQRMPIEDHRLDDLIIPLLRVCLKLGVAAVGVIYIARSLSIDILPLVTGLGIGGLAVAFAAKDSIENFFGSVTVVLDEVFRVGDWVIVEGNQGTVEKIGFRSTRIRAFDYGLITVPNATLVRSVVTNMGRRSHRRFDQNLGLTYDTPPEKMKEFCDRLWDLAKKHDKVQKDTSMVAFKGFGASSLEIYFRVFLAAETYYEEMALKHEFCEAILNTAAEVGVDFAFPTQTLHVASMPEVEMKRAGGE